jgi:hypothetical protein
MKNTIHYLRKKFVEIYGTFLSRISTIFANVYVNSQRKKELILSVHYFCERIGDVCEAHVLVFCEEVNERREREEARKEDKVDTGRFSGSNCQHASIKCLKSGSQFSGICGVIPWSLKIYITNHTIQHKK